ncbi:uncharacterized protein LOC142987082 [Anticarsia gemmatalis]|uniref:uncharacterized protein LOC142987082 n=1 Tax=Anticarsia gemmatalis TaxID=129554 RepID=UPI003F76CF62
MDGLEAVITVFTLFAVHSSEAVPPDVCNVNFRWDDCGGVPQPVMYYWKPGSRCEVGIWRGCRPSLNMFKNEYECVSTCIFSVRADPSDWHETKETEADEEETSEGGTGDQDESGGTDGGSGETGASGGDNDDNGGGGDPQPNPDGDGGDATDEGTTAGE